MPLIDARLPVTFAAAPTPEDGVLREGEGEGEAAPGTAWFQAGHAAGCACCGGRTGAGIALQRLLHGRARGEGPFFRRVVVEATTAPGRADVLRALAEDPLAASCFRLSPGEAGE